MGLILVSGFKEKSRGHQKPSEEPSGCNLTSHGRQSQRQGWSTLEKQVSSQAGFFPPRFTGRPSHSWGTWSPALSWFGAIRLEWYNWGYHPVFLQMSRDILVHRVSQLPNNAPKSQIPKKCSFFRHGEEPFCALYKQKMNYWSVYIFHSSRKAWMGWALTWNPFLPMKAGEELFPAGSSRGGDALVVLTGCTDESWLDIKLIKLGNFKTQEGEIGPLLVPFALFVIPPLSHVFLRARKNSDYDKL